MLNYNEVAFDAADTNKDGQLTLGEYYYSARAAGNLNNTAGISIRAEQPYVRNLKTDYFFTYPGKAIRFERTKS